MERRRNLVRRVAPAGLALLVIGGLSGCGGDGPVGRAPAAVVDGREISADRVLELSRAYAELQQGDLDAALDADPAGDVTELRTSIEEAAGDGADTYATSSAATSLQQLVLYEAVRAELDREDIEVSVDDVETARTEFTDSLLESYQSGGGAGGAGLSEAAAQAKVDLIPDHLLDVTAATQAAQAKLAPLLAETLSEDEQEARFQELLAQYREERPYCVSAAFALDEAAAQAARDRIDGGEDFEAVAAQTLNPVTGAPGGPFGCGSAEDVSTSFGVDPSALAEGDVFGPVGPVPLSADVSTFVVAQITSITGDTEERARPSIEEQIQAEATAPDATTSEGQARLQARALELAQEADVTVDPRYGTWDATVGELVPPADPSAPATTTAGDVVATDPNGS